MAYKNEILLGRITKVSGYEGAVIVKLEKIFIGKIPQMESVFLEIEGRPVPFFITVLEYSGADILKVEFIGYNSGEKINEFIGCRIFLTTGINNDDYADETQNLIGYKVYIEDDKLLGSVSEVISNNGQWLLNVLIPPKRGILIPFHEHFIVSIDKKKKIIVMNIPEGLTDIN
jgi:16S rRNA processing protein RimM